MKKIAIEGTNKNVLKAFLADITALGAPIDSGWNKDMNPDTKAHYMKANKLYIFQPDAKEDKGYGWYTILPTKVRDYTIYSLPRQYEEALEAVKASLKPVYKEGDWVKTKKDSGSMNGRELSGTVVKIGTIHPEKYFVGDKNAGGGIWLSDIERMATLEEIFEAEFPYKVGDYIFYAYDGENARIPEEGVQIIEALENQGTPGILVHTNLTKNLIYLKPSNASKVRMATPEEIEKASAWKVGDWVMCLRDGQNDTPHKLYQSRTAIYKGNIFQIAGFDKHSGGDSQRVAITTDGGVVRIDANGAFRRATAKEIQEGTAPIHIAGYDALCTDGIVSFGCQTWTKEQIQGLIQIVDNGGTISFGKQEVSGKLLRKILRRIK